MSCFFVCHKEKTPAQAGEDQKGGIDSACLQHAVQQDYCFTDPAQREKFLKLVENVENQEIKKADCLPMRNIRFGIHIIPPPVLRQAVHHLFCRLIKLVKYFPVFLVNSMVFHVGFN